MRRPHKHSKNHSVCTKLPVDEGVRVPGDAINNAKYNNIIVQYIKNANF